MPEDPTDPGHTKPPPPQPALRLSDLIAENADLKAQIAALSDNDLSASQQLMAARHDLLAANARADHLQSLLDARDKMAAQVAESGVFDVKPQAVDL